jgi:hypothetical protein
LEYEPAIYRLLRASGCEYSVQFNGVCRRKNRLNGTECLGAFEILRAKRDKLLAQKDKKIAEITPRLNSYVTMDLFYNPVGCPPACG